MQINQKTIFPNNPNFPQLPQYLFNLNLSYYFMQETPYEILKPEQFSEEIKKFEENIKKDPENPLNYYYLAKEYILKVPIRALESCEYIEGLLKKSLELTPELWAPKIFLGELLFKQGKYSESESYFKKASEEKPESISVREYLAKCMEKNSNSKREYSEKELLYLFENDLRKFIKKTLQEKFGELWWRKGVPAKTRSACASKREEGLEEEMDLDLILFANFYDYKGILQENGSEFSQYMNVKAWCKILGELEPIRNVIAHNRDLNKAFEKIEKAYLELKKIIAKN